MQPVILGDVGKLSEPITKLVESVEKGVGGLTRPKQIIRVAKAQAVAKKIEAKTELDIAKMKLEMAPEMYDLAERALSRIGYREVRRQANIEAIVQNAVGFLPEQVNEDPVDDDWMVHFFGSCQDIGNEEMQLLWAKLLAGEIAEPGTYSYRALELIRTLQPSDAQIIEKIRTYLWESPSGLFVIQNDNIDEYFEKQSVYYDHFAHLDALGIINIDFNLGVILRPDSGTVFSYLDNVYIVLNTKKLKVHITTHIFTKLGEEIMGLCDKSYEEEYCELSIKYLKQLGLFLEKLEVSTTENFETIVIEANKVSNKIIEKSIF